ncbi:predicted protein [Plenodomus lingam JN3]|uniref:Predicted protein n=1 Tax=Leptosphaeria maculans (strain JN3 / isolate v23.1.3 / race Av1-4-5-6-7-8) TaxID=985895 RepID=E5A8V3_LEPMJ|nr:predicted protein [Plenodomus lingam JN3]CBY00048.1 predicted protein [Plenodomus lingam JN3]
MLTEAPVLFQIQAINLMDFDLVFADLVPGVSVTVTMSLI